jgi:PhzF family phenazine biosynthesis protein
MRIPIYQVDAFSDRVFAGNPAAVCPLDRWLPDDRLQQIAAENNLSETAFFIPAQDGGYELRWFTPAVEVELCGHATLASGFVIATLLRPGCDRIEFATRRAGTLIVSREGDRFTLDFPARPAAPAEPHAGLIPALGGPAPDTVLLAPGNHGEGNYLVVYGSEAEVRALRPRFGDLPGPKGCGVIVTAPGSAGVDFVSRYFAPAAGIDEDPVTGSTHCTLTPYWAARLGKEILEARQVSARGGALSCRLNGDRVLIAGRAALYLEGSIHV